MPEDGKYLNLTRVGGFIQVLWFNKLFAWNLHVSKKNFRITLARYVLFFYFNPFVLKLIQDYSLCLINQFELFDNLLLIYVNILSKWCILIYHFGKIVLS